MSTCDKIWNFITSRQEQYHIVKLIILDTLEYIERDMNISDDYECQYNSSIVKKKCKQMHPNKPKSSSYKRNNK